MNKEFWTGLKASAEKTVLKQENNGILRGKDGYLFERFKQPGEQLKANIESISYFTEKATNVTSYFMLVPTSVEIYPEKLPLFAQTASQKEAMDDVKEKIHKSIKWIDTNDLLIQSKNEQIYFHTDHHWTTRGAYVAYKAASKEMDFKAYEKDDFNIETVSTNFYGTYYTKANDYSVEADAIEIFKPKFDLSYHVEIRRESD